MAWWSKRGARDEAPDGEAHANEAEADAVPAGSASGGWKRMLVPATGRPFSARGVELAYSLARQDGAALLLAYIMEVPRSLVLDATLPDEESQAQVALEAAQSSIRGGRVEVQPTVHRVRSARDGILRLISQERVDLLVLGLNADGVHGIPSDLARELYERVTCEVLVDYVAAVK